MSSAQETAPELRQCSGPGKVQRPGKQNHAVHRPAQSEQTHRRERRVARATNGLRYPRLDAVVNALVELVPPIVDGLSGRDPGVRRTGSWSRCG